MDIEKITISVEGNSIVGQAYVFDQAAVKKRPLLILCHGIPRGDLPQEGADADAEPDGGYAALAERCLAEGFSCFHFNFRGTGESGGNFDLSGWNRDLVAVLDYWEERGLFSSFYLWGFSAGAAVSCHVASFDGRVGAVALAAGPAEFNNIFTLRDIDGIITRFRSVGIIRDASFPEDPESWLKGIHSVNPLASVARISPRPLLIVHGTGDDVIPCEDAHKLYERAGEPKQLLIIPEAEHQLRKNQEAVSACLKWFKKL